MNSLALKYAWCWVLGTVLLLALTAEAQDMTGPPPRPDVFRNPQELRDYLKALNEYFAIVGRPRFGRSVSKRSTYSFKRNANSFNNLDMDGDGMVTPDELSYYANYVLGGK